MPYLTKRKIIVKQDNHETQDRHNDKWNKYYQNRQWKLLRDYYMQLHPICADCAIEGRSVPAEECHHKIVFSWFESKEDRMKALLDPDNIISLCRSCHMKRHKNLIKPDNFEQTEYYKKIHNS